MSYHFFAMFLGFVLDLLFGDPHWLPHPIRLIGNLIASLEKLNKKELSDTKKFLRGFAMVVVVIAWTTGVAAVIHYDLSDSCYKVSESGKHEGI